MPVLVVNQVVVVVVVEVVIAVAGTVMVVIGGGNVVDVGTTFTAPILFDSFPALPTAETAWTYAVNAKDAPVRGRHVFVEGAGPASGVRRSGRCCSC